MKTLENREDFTTQLAERILDGMDMSTLMSFALDRLCAMYDELPEAEVIGIAKEFAPDMLEDEDD